MTDQHNVPAAGSGGLGQGPVANTIPDTILWKVFGEQFFSGVSLSQQQSWDIHWKTEACRYPLLKHMLAMIAHYLGKDEPERNRLLDQLKHHVGIASGGIAPTGGQELRDLMSRFCKREDYRKKLSADMHRMLNQGVKTVTSRLPVESKAPATEQAARHNAMSASKYAPAAVPASTPTTQTATPRPTVAPQPLPSSGTKQQVTAQPTVQAQAVTEAAVKAAAQSAPTAKSDTPDPSASTNAEPEAGPVSAEDESQSSTDADATTSKPMTLADVAAMWKYLPIPADEPEPHDEFAWRNDEAPGGMRVIGARARGKTHKHGGTNCDDWFDFVFSDKWTMIAVSDGAGSKKFSRVGARAACTAALSVLKERFTGFTLKERSAWDGQVFRRDESTHNYLEEDVAHVETSLHNAARAALEAMKAACDERSGKPEYEKVLGGRPIVVDDLSATLLLAVHTEVPRAGAAPYHFVFTCQVGDGFIAAFNSSAHCIPLAKVDTGGFSSETHFLTSKGELADTALRSRTFGTVSPIRALMIMSDGVADDFCLPPETGMLELYSELALNGVLPLTVHSDESVKAALTGTDLGRSKDWKAEIETWEYHDDVLRITADEPRPIVKVRSPKLYADKLGVKPENLPQRPEWLWAGFSGDAGWHKDNTLADAKTIEERLVIWLDTYYRRTSFDDRTLVILFKELV